MINDKRLPSIALRLFPKLVVGILLIEIISYLINPNGTITSLLHSTELLSFIGFILFGLIIGFGLIAYDVMGMAGE